MSADTAWQAGRFDARRGPKCVLFGRMYEDVAIERSALPRGGRVFCIASAGCTALDLCQRHDVVACDINPEQLAYARRRIDGAPVQQGTAEKVLGFGRALSPLAGWSGEVLRTFLAMTEPAKQVEYWGVHLDTWRFRTGFDAMVSLTGLRAVYGRPFLDFLPPHFGAVLRARMKRCFALHPNADNPYARALLLGEAESQHEDARPVTIPDGHPSSRITLVLSDAATYLEGCAPGTFTGVTLSNILDGAQPSYRTRLLAAVRHACTPDGMVVLRSFGEADAKASTNRAAEDRSMLWGIVDVRPASA